MQSDDHVFTGMKRDMHPIRQDAQFMWNAFNIRITRMDNNTQLSITNEKSPKEVGFMNLSYIGHCVLGKYLVMFMHDETTGQDSIIRCTEENGSIDQKLLFLGNLGFSKENPIQAIGIAEQNLINKIYWVDGKNHPRVINITIPELKEKTSEYTEFLGYTNLYSKKINNTIFDFSPLCKLEEEITCKADNSLNGLFTAGVIQYAFTYFFKYGQETSIVHTSQLIPLAEKTRGGEPGKTISAGVKITIENYDTDFDYIRVYSILRTSIDSTPVAKKVADIQIVEKKDQNGKLIPIVYDDLGTEGEIIDPTQLLYTGSKSIIPECIYSKENTLFLGNIKYRKESIRNIYIGGESISSLLRKKSGSIKCIGNAIGENDGYEGYDGGKSNGIVSAIDYNNMVNLNPIGFKTGNIYRLGVQFQYKTGEWSEPVFIGDKEQEVHPDLGPEELITPGYSFDITEFINELTIKGYKKARPLVVLPKINERVVIAQGLLCPTVFKVGARDMNAPFSQSSWFIRPTMNERGIYGKLPEGDSDAKKKIKREYNYKWEKGSPTQWKHLHPLMCFYRHTAIDGEGDGGYSHSFINGINPRTVEIQNTVIDRCSFGFKYSQGKNTGIIPWYNAYSGSSEDKGKNIRKKQKGWREIPYLQKVAFVKGRYSFKNKDGEYSNYFDEPILDVNSSLDNTDESVQWTKQYAYTHHRDTRKAPSFSSLKKLNSKSFDSQYFVDRSIITMHSPDIEFNDSVKSYIDANKDLDVCIVGSTSFINNYGNIQITTGSATIGSDGEGVIHKIINGNGSIVSGLFYRDRKADDRSDGATIGPYRNPRGYMVHLWNCSNSLNNDIDRMNYSGTRTAVLTTKRMSNVKSCSRTWWFSKEEIERLSNGDVHLFNSNDITMIKLKEENCIFDESTYYGNVDDLSSCIPYYAKQAEQGDVSELTDDNLGNSDNENDDEINETENSTEFDISFNSVLTYVDEDDNDIGDRIINLKKKTDTARIRYKSTPHVVFALNGKNSANEDDSNILPSFCDSEIEDIFSVHSVMTKGRGGSNGSVSPLIGVIDTNNGYEAEQNGVKHLPSDNEGPINHAPYVMRNSDIYWNKLGKTDENYYKEYGCVNFTKRKFPLYANVYTDDLTSLGFEWKKDLPSTMSVSMSDVMNPGIGNPTESENELITGSLAISSNNPYPSSWIAELRRNNVDKDTLFGGSSEEALKNNLWLIAGEAVPLTGNTVELKYKWGDTWYQQFEMLKTYAFSQEDVNQVVEIGRFLCESYINIGGRYDRNQGELNSSLYANPANFNLINPVYSQLNNFFTYRILDDDYYKNQEYGNQILVSSAKVNGDMTDNWTHVHAATSLELDNKLGSVTSINSNNDTLVAFQEKGMSQILFNSRIQVNASDGVPIEIANSQKVDGYRIISDSIGCLDKFAIAETNSGIYFADSATKNIYRLENGIENLSASLGTMYWLKDMDYKSKWYSGFHKKDDEDTELKENGIRTSFDSLNNDVYFIPGCSEKKENALCFSLLLNQFTSFYPYEGGVLFNWNKKTYGINGYRVNEGFTPGEYGDSTVRYIDRTCIYEMFAKDDRCKGFDGEQYTFEFSFISNKDPQMTKIFDTIEYEGSVLDDNNMELSDGSGYSLTPIDSLRVENEYQDTDECKLNDSSKKLDVKKKFRIWRMIIPRNSMKKMERIRNPWTKITMKGIENADKKCIIHNVSVKYSV